MDFQNFFAKIMGYIDPGFVPIKPYGNWGDGGNDGCNSDTKHYYQIYAPVATTKVNAQEALRKAVTDYQKLLDSWGVVVGYSFVINDKFTTVEAPLQRSFVEFKEAKKILEGKIIHTQELQKLFMQLHDDGKMDVLDIYHLPPSDTDFNPTTLGELIKYLLNKPDMSMTLLTGQAPDFEEKIKFNGLNEALANRLKVNSLEVYKIDDFLDTQGDDGIDQELSQTVNDIYIRAASKIPDEEEQRNELIYLSLMNELIPNIAKDKIHSLRGYNKVAEIIIAKYFETCDVYEDPNSAYPS